MVGFVPYAIAWQGRSVGKRASIRVDRGDGSRKLIDHEQVIRWRHRAGGIVRVGRRNSHVERVRQRATLHDGVAWGVRRLDQRHKRLNDCETFLGAFGCMVVATGGDTRETLGTTKNSASSSAWRDNTFDSERERCAGSGNGEARSTLRIGDRSRVTRKEHLERRGSAVRYGVENPRVISGHGPVDDRYECSVEGQLDRCGIENQRLVDLYKLE